MTALRPSGRSPWIGRTVKVIGGPNRNKRGVVVAITDDVLTIEEHVSRTLFSALTSEIKTID